MKFRKPEKRRIRHRMQDEARKAVSELQSELHHYGHYFSTAEKVKIAAAVAALTELYVD